MDGSNPETTAAPVYDSPEDAPAPTEAELRRSLAWLRGEMPPMGKITGDIDGPMPPEWYTDEPA